MYFQQAAKYPTLTTIRSTNDGYQQAYWIDHIFTSRFAWSMGMFPWTDNFKSTNGLTGCIIWCVPSGRYFRAIRPDRGRSSRLIFFPRPGATVPSSSATYRRFPPRRRIALLPNLRPPTRLPFPIPTMETISRPIMYGRREPPATSYSFSPAAEGFPASANGMYAYNWFSKTGQFVAAGSSLTATCATGTNAFHYWVVAPVGASRDSLSRRFKQIHFMRQTENNIARSFRDASVGDGRSQTAGGLP